MGVPDITQYLSYLVELAKWKMWASIDMALLDTPIPDEEICKNFPPSCENATSYNPDCFEDRGAEFYIKKAHDIVWNPHRIKDANGVTWNSYTASEGRKLIFESLENICQASHALKVDQNKGKKDLGVLFTHWLNCFYGHSIDSSYTHDLGYHCTFGGADALDLKRFDIAEAIYLVTPPEIVPNEDHLRLAAHYFEEKAYINALLHIGNVIEYFENSPEEYLDALIFEGWCYSKLSMLPEAFTDFWDAKQRVEMYRHEETHKDKVLMSIALLLIECDGKNCKASQDYFLDLLSEIDTKRLLAELKKSIPDYPLTISDTAGAFYSGVMLTYKNGDMERFDLLTGKLLELMNSPEAVKVISKRMKEKEPLLRMVNALVERGDFLEENPREATKLFIVAEKIASIGLKVFGEDRDLIFQKGRAVLRVAPNIEGTDDKDRKSTKKYYEALGLLKRSYELFGSENSPKEVATEYGIALSELGEHIIDYKLGSQDVWERYLDSAEAILLTTVRRFPKYVEVLLNLAWDEYYRGKGLKKYKRSLDKAKEIWSQIKTIGNTADSEVTEIARIYLWSACEMAYEELEGSHSETALQTLMDNKVEEVALDAYKHIRGSRWKKDLVWTIYRVYYLTGRAQDENRTKIMADSYEECMTKSNRENLRQNPDSILSYNKAVHYLDVLDGKDKGSKGFPLEQRPGHVDKARGWIAARLGKYDDALTYFRNALKGFPVNDEGRRADTKRGMIEALKNRNCYESPPLRETLNNMLEITELAVENVLLALSTDKGMDVKDIRQELLPVFRVAMDYGKNNPDNKEYHDRLGRILETASTIKETELQELIKKYKDDLAALKKQKSKPPKPTSN